MITNEIKNYSYKLYNITFVSVDKIERKFEENTFLYATLAESVEQVKSNFAKFQKIDIDDIVDCRFVELVKKSIPLIDLI